MREKRLCVHRESREKNRIKAKSSFDHKPNVKIVRDSTETNIGVSRERRVCYREVMNTISNARTQSGIRMNENMNENVRYAEYWDMTIFYAISHDGGQRNFLLVTCFAATSSSCPVRDR